MLTCVSIDSGGSKVPSECLQVCEMADALETQPHAFLP